MEQRPEQPPEGKLIAAAAERMNLSIREAARRAGISYGRWRQIVTGYQNVSPGSYAEVRAPAKTLAKMARTVGITPEQMRSEGQRPDAADLMGDIPAARDAHADSSPVPISEEQREAGQDRADEIQDLLTAAAIRTGSPDPPGDEIFPAGSWDAQTWDRLRRPVPSTQRRLWMIALASVPDVGQPSRRLGSAAGLTPEAALSRGSSAGGGA